MPFITEEIYTNLVERKEDDIILSSQLIIDNSDKSEILTQGEALKNIITAIRDVKVKQGLKPKDEIDLFLPESYKTTLDSTTDVMQKQSFAKNISFVNAQVENSISFVIDKFQCYITTDKQIDNSQQLEQLKKDLDYYKGFLISVEKKLGNEKFVANAKPEILEAEVKKKNDALEKLKIIEESLNLL
jgi:valyl-tRNA synthetase